MQISEPVDVFIFSLVFLGDSGLQAMLINRNFRLALVSVVVIRRGVFRTALATGI